MGCTEDFSYSDGISPISENLAKTLVIQPHVKLAELQNFSGSWNFNVSLADCIEVPFEYLKQAVTTTCNIKYSCSRVFIDLIIVCVMFLQSLSLEMLTEI